MSYLNALASNGLSVGLRLYGNRASVAPNLETGPTEAELYSQTEPTKPTEKSTRVEPIPQTPEERAAGRAEALAALASTGSIGQLQETRATRSQKTDEKSQEEQYSEEDAPVAPKELTKEEKEQVQKLKERDREVKAHEQAHRAAAGGLAGSPTYVYQTGPDGERYAIGGEVSVHTGGSGDPKQALREAEAVKRAAEAPSSPSSQDRAVAAAASADINRLKAEVNEVKEEEKAEEEDNSESFSLGAPNANVTEKGPADLNGLSLSQKAVRAYEAVKNSLNYGSRPILARI